MNAAEMLARDLVLRVCACDGEFRRDWLTGGVPHKRVVPLAVAQGVDPGLADAIAGAAVETGADRLLACRTRAAFMYDTVTVLPASGRALLDLAARWAPDDFLVCLPDGSAAVLVSMTGYALGAGPPLFIAALGGPDVGGARARFAAWAQNTGDQRLRLLAGRYGGGPSSRHASRRTLRPDIPERLSALAAAVRGRHVLTAVLRACRAAVGWGAVAVIVVTLLSAPRASHVLPVLAGTVWLILQVFALARTHTLSWAACLRMVAVGAACAAAIAAMEWLATGRGPVHGWPALAGPAEEVAALVPIAAFWLAARHRFTRLATVDYVLIGVASGAGFSLVQGIIAALAAPGTGWHLAALLPGWMDAGPVRFPGHAVSTGLITAGIGLAVAARPRGVNGQRARWRLWRLLTWLLPPALLGMAMLDHYHYDAAAEGAGVPSWVSRVHAAAGDGHASGWLLLGLLATAVAVDFRAQHRVLDVVPPLPGVPRWAGLARAARGSVITARLRWPGRSMRGLLALRWAGLRVATAETLVAMYHEVAFLLVAVRRSSRRPAIFAASLAFTRQRRELAMREARAGGQARRDVPRRAGLWSAWRALTATLAIGGATALAALLPLSGTHLRLHQALLQLPWQHHTTRGSPTAQLAHQPPAAELTRLTQVAGWTARARLSQFGESGRPGGVALRGGLARLASPARLGGVAGTGPLAGLTLLHGRGGGANDGLQLRPGDLASGIGALHVWFSQFVPAGQVLIVAAGLSVLILLVSGWALPVPLPSRQGAKRPGRVVRGLVEHTAHATVPAPGQLALRVLRLTGELLPPATARLLRGKPVARPYQRLPAAQQALRSAELLPATPPSAAVEVAPAAARRRPRGDTPGRSGWLFPQDRVRRWLGHAPDFGVGSRAVNGEPADPAELAADLTGALRQIAEAAGSLRFDDVTFRNHPARAVVDRATGAAVFFSPAGEFAGCALLTEEQLSRLVTELRL